MLYFFFFFPLDSFFATSQYCSRYIRLPFLYSGFYIHEHYLALPVAMGLELDDVCGPFQRRPFYDSILWNCVPLQPEWRCEAGRAAKKLTVPLENSWEPWQLPYLSTISKLEKGSNKPSVTSCCLTSFIHHSPVPALTRACLLPFALGRRFFFAACISPRY